MRPICLFLLAMLVFVNALADPVLLTIDAFLFGLRQMAVMSRHIFLFAILYGGLALLEISGLLRIQLAALHAVRDALLLIFFAAIHLVHTRMSRIDNARPRSRSS